MSSEKTKVRIKRKHETGGSNESNENEQTAKKRRVASPSSSDTQDGKGQDIKQIIAAFEDNCLFERLREHNDENYNKELFTTIEEAYKKKETIVSNKKILKLAKAFMIREGIGTKKDEKSAFNDIKSLHDERFYQATNSLGVCYHLGLGVNQDYKTAFKLYKISAAKDYPLAYWNLGLCHKDGLGTKKDNQLAFESFKQSAELGYIKAQVDFGVDLFEGKFDSATYSFSNHDTRKGTWQQQLACEYWEKAAKKGNPVAMHNLAESFLQGLGVELNEEQAIDYFEKAANKGYAPSQRELGILFFKKQDTKKEAKEKATVHLQNAVKNGDTYAIYYLGVLYQEGFCIAQAEKQFEEAAKSTHIDWSFLKTPPQKLQECLKSNLTKIYKNYLNKEVTETKELTSLCYLAYNYETGSLGYNKDVTEALNIYNYAQKNGLKYFALGEKTINIQDKIIATKKQLQMLARQQAQMMEQQQAQMMEQKQQDEMEHYQLQEKQENQRIMLLQKQKKEIMLLQKQQQNQMMEQRLAQMMEQHREQMKKQLEKEQIVRWQLQQKQANRMMAQQPTQVQQKQAQMMQLPQQPNSSLTDTKIEYISTVANDFIKQHKNTFKYKKNESTNQETKSNTPREQGKLTRIYNERKAELCNLTRSKPNLILTENKIKKYLEKGQGDFLDLSN